MTLRLTGQSEQENKYKEFYGCPLDQLPILHRDEYKPISISGIIARRLSAPVDILDSWRDNYFFAIDGAAYNEKGDAKIVLDSTLLQHISPESNICRELPQGALHISEEDWNELQGENVLYLKASEVDRAHDKGYIFKNRTWQPANKIVGKVWQHLSRNTELREYAKLVHKATGKNQVMNIMFHRYSYSNHVLRPWLVGRVGDNSMALGLGNLLYKYGRFAGRISRNKLQIKKESSVRELYALLLQ